MSNLLVITNGFPDIRNDKYNCHFVYEYVNLVRDEFEKIYVISPQSFIPKWVRQIPFFKRFSGYYIEADGYKIGNIEIFFPKINYFPINIFFSKFKIYQGYKIISKIASKINLSLIHSHFIFPAGYYSNRLSKEYNVPYLITSHEGDIENSLKKTKKETAISLKNATKIIAVSEINKNCLEKYFPSIIVEKIHNFIDLNKFHIADKRAAKKSLGLDGDVFLILNVANLIINRKGQLDLLEIAKKLKSNGSNACIHLVGQGLGEKIISQKIIESDLINHVKLNGAISNKNLLTWYNAADLFVFPSYSESFGIVQIEALACGTPVISYANKGSKEVLKGCGDNLVEIGNIEKLLIKIESAMADPNLNSEEARAQRRDYVKNNFSEKKIKHELLQIYKDTISTYRNRVF